MRAERRSLARVEGAFKERAEDGWLDLAPIELRRRRELFQFARRQVDGIGGREEPAIEARDFVHAENAPIAHRREELRRLMGKDARSPGAERQQPREQAIRQQADIFGEEAKEQLDQEVRRPHRLDVASVQRRRQLAELRRRRLRDHLAPAARLKRPGIGEDAPQRTEDRRVGEIGDGEGDRLRRQAREVGMELEADEVTADEQRRVRQIVHIAAQLDVGAFEVAAGPLVLEREGAALPGIDKTLAAFELADGMLEGEVSGGIVRRLGLIEERAKVVEVRLRRRSLAEESWRVAPNPLKLQDIHPAPRRVILKTYDGC